MNIDEVVLEHTRKYGFAPTSAGVLEPLLARCKPDGLTRSIDSLYPQLLPSVSFSSCREGVKERYSLYIYSGTVYIYIFCTVYIYSGTVYILQYIYSDISFFHKCFHYFILLF